MASLVQAVRSLAIVLDEEASKWFTTFGDRARATAGGPGGLVSPAGLAAEIPRRAGVTPPLLKFRVPTDLELRCWIAAHRGGGSQPSSQQRLFSRRRRHPFAYPAFAALLAGGRS